MVHDPLDRRGGGLLPKKNWTDYSVTRHVHQTDRLVYVDSAKECALLPTLHATPHNAPRTARGGGRSLHPFLPPDSHRLSTSGLA